MSKRDLPTDGIERRSILAALATGVGGFGLFRTPLARGKQGTQYVLEQAGRCVPVTPLSGDKTVEALYDYRLPSSSPSGTYASYGTTNLQRPETSILFLYDGPRGLSLVVVHDKLNDGTSGGAVTFRLDFDHPGRGSWVVEDDNYDAPTNYDTFTRTDTGWKVDWTWMSGRSDGGAYRPLGDDFSLTIDPAFNEGATLYGQHYTGAINDWQLLSGDMSNPQRIPLSMNRPVTLRTGSCGESDRTGSSNPSRGGDQSGMISVDAEIVPGKVNPDSHGRLPVVVHSNADFDATDIESGTVEFGPAGATPVGRHRTNADGDSRPDLTFLFQMDKTGIGWGTGSTKFIADTTDGRTVVGRVDVNLVPRGGHDNRNNNDGNDWSGDGRQQRRGSGQQSNDAGDSPDLGDPFQNEGGGENSTGNSRDGSDDHGSETDHGKGDAHGNDASHGSGDHWNGDDSGNDAGHGWGSGKGRKRGHDEGRGRDSENGHGHGKKSDHGHGKKNGHGNGHGKKNGNDHGHD